MTALRSAVGDLKTLNVSLAPTRENLMSAGAWKASKAYSVNDIIYPTAGNGYQYKCTVAGTSGATQPTWPTTVGNTIVDGGVTWTCQTNTFTLPTANPGVAGAQVSYTIASADLPAFSGAVPTSYLTVGNLWIAGFNAGSAAGTIQFQVFKNGASYLSGGTNSTNAAYYATSIAGLGTLAVGDQIQIALWSTTTNMYWDYWGIQLYPSRMQVSTNALAYNLTYTLTTITPKVGSGGSPSYSPGWYILPVTNANISFQLTNLNVAITFPSFGWNKDSYTGRLYYGDNFTNSVYGNTASSTASYRPYTSCAYPTQIQFREVRLR